MAYTNTHELQRRARETLAPDDPSFRIHVLFREQKDTYRFAAPPYAISEIRSIFEEECPGTKSMIDMTAHVGHDAALFLLTWPGLKITLCELRKDNIALLTENVQRAYAEGAISKLSSINIKAGDSVAYLASEDGRKERVDFVYIDAPWESDGKRYSRRDSAPLQIGGVDIDEVARRVLERKTSDVVVLKVPVTVASNSLISRVMQWRDCRCKCTVRSVAYRGRDRSRTVCFYLLFIKRM